MVANCSVVCVGPEDRYGAAGDAALVFYYHISDAKHTHTSIH